MMSRLDDPEAYRRTDPSGLGGRVAELPTQCRDAWVKAQAFPLPEDYGRVDRILVLGMGGSAIGGALLADLQAFQKSIPVDVHRGYGWPYPTDERTLVIASSYSGNTEETLAAFNAEWKPGLKAVACTTGGALARAAALYGIPLFPIEFQGEPRSALGYSLFSLLGFLQRLRIGPDRSEEAASAIKQMQRLAEEIGPRVPLAANRAKQIAKRAQGKVVIAYGAQHLVSVARRWKGQVAENAKGWAFFDELPEMNHNSIEGLRFPAAFAGQVFAVLFRSALFNPRIALRCLLTRDLLMESGVQCEVVEPIGDSPLTQMMTAILLGDFVSYYLAILNEVDPAAIPNLERLKGWMASR